jgi:hypothetical protein
VGVLAGPGWRFSWRRFSLDRDQETSCESFGETEEESRKETDQAAEQEEKRKEE